MGDFRQSVHFTSSPDGVRLAYAVCGRGHPLVRVPTWISHVEHDWQSPVMRHLVVEMASRHKLVNYDCRGVGMSERDVTDMSFDAWVHDLEAVPELRLARGPVHQGRDTFGGHVQDEAAGAVRQDLALLDVDNCERAVLERTPSWSTLPRCLPRGEPASASPSV